MEHTLGKIKYLSELDIKQSVDVQVSYVEQLIKKLNEISNGRSPLSGKEFLIEERKRKIENLLKD